MKVLGIDTSNLILSVAVVEEEKVLGEYTTNLQKNHSTRLMPAISMLLDELTLDPQELGAIAVAHGPGSYTGVRIGISTAKTLAWAAGIPIVGISSLQVLAGNVPFFPGRICPLFDARRGQVYTALFHESERVADDALRMLDDWLNQLDTESLQVLFLGDDLALHKGTIQQRLGKQAVFGQAEWNIPRASYIARTGVRHILEGRQVKASEIVPQYLQLAEAEAKWLANQGSSEQVDRV
jgi:tRNA threonylcarbamoyladenosine biosynthesis protein TsaB